jgi:hypothetical protein
MIPLPDKLASVQALIACMLSNHRAGFSWNRDLKLSDMHIFDGKVVIRKAPVFFKTLPYISIEMIRAIEADLRWVAYDILTKFNGDVVPYLKTFSTLLKNMDQYREWWKKPATAEGLRDLIEHNPFLKPSMARANLLSDIHTGYRSYDE